jgi:hypothetical protein
MSFLRPAWTNFVADHASDADKRKYQDPDEAPRHYIDIDNYPEFVSNGFITHAYDSAVALHGLSFVIDQGILPWATLRSYDSLKKCFQRGDWSRSELFAADLGHYVGDGHMPLHITRNYNGQFTGQLEIHSRYESSMISKYESLLVYPIDSAVVVSDVRTYIFNYLYTNYKYVDSVLLADTYATSTAGNIGSDAYYQALWAKSGPFTIDLMRRGSCALASLIYSAWVEAGSPVMYPNALDDHEIPGQQISLQCHPNPAGGMVCFVAEICDQHIPFRLEIYDLSGNLVEVILRNPDGNGNQEVQWNTGDLVNGTYVCVLKSGIQQSVRRLVVNR